MLGDVDETALRTLFEELIPFNKLLGLKLERFTRTPAQVVSRLELRPEHIGNALRGMPHGGLLSALIDATAGAAAAVAVGDPERIPGVATIDMRVDYLKPAAGVQLLTTSDVMRSGSRVVVVRSELHDELGTLVALGSNVFNVAR
ncbi:thioesterase superfamily protein [Truepera radiovictrix DSM 17093]|uniref:Medium/long-chain acyl-CoA thioesterase YigI n=1 Tax=Truepera radiovictrix (strain DSM 17093 / CIP 108686 / LMG 22925 / RQ-24) TaxID=649638 RepID=D7CVY7_TRURR|nr:thioesterase superfamily protein [Truepera radiovictrix DSM 17093]